MARSPRLLVDVIKRPQAVRAHLRHEHITAEGWTTLGGMLGVVPVVVWTRPNETGDGYVARVEARTLDGRVVGAAESECSRAERKWKTADPYAIRSMAQTRAIGRALRAPLGQIVVLAGYEARRPRRSPAIAEPEREAGAVRDRSTDEASSRDRSRSVMLTPTLDAELDRTPTGEPCRETPASPARRCSRRSTSGAADQQGSRTSSSTRAESRTVAA